MVEVAREGTNGVQIVFRSGCTRDGAGLHNRTVNADKEPESDHTGCGDRRSPCSQLLLDPHDQLNALTALRADVGCGVKSRLGHRREGPLRARSEVYQIAQSYSSHDGRYSWEGANKIRVHPIDAALLLTH